MFWFISRYSKQSWRNRLIFVWSPVNGIGLFILYSLVLSVITCVWMTRGFVMMGPTGSGLMSKVTSLQRQITGRDEVVLDLQGLVLVLLVQLLFL
jgi:hypothetical protein